MITGGYGRHAAWIYKRFNEIDLHDACKNQLKYFKDNLHIPAGETFDADVSTFRLDRPYGLIFCNWSFEYMNRSTIGK